VFTSPRAGGTVRLVLRFHHVNLGVPVGEADAEAAFLTDYLNYRRVELTPGVPPTARWFESEDGKQVHLSEDADHRPAARAHVAVELGDDLATLERKFDETGYQYQAADGADRRTVFCQDPAGNRWELRGTRPV
jgi:catechol 2,3-dioxygenase-like lactoylglutathione lyase family enzyme